MRLWSIHPRYLDRAGFLAVWREALLAQCVLQGKTKGYRNHPQLVRFIKLCDPLGGIGSYLDGIYHESARRGYCFNEQKINPSRLDKRITVTSGQVQYEWCHLKNKLRQRNRKVLMALQTILQPDVHPLFTVIEGGIEYWEKITASSIQSD